ncbi:uncharacterized protein LOC131801226 [Musca domestica]|uniref:Uncharacterized protein LOC131801226 n=1 Tax=Musca domestica TaxID=7370 RepID=A0ABM3UPU1_MUSDO|nr:uncharacterized protein LOC131801226 [Musca domestica]
MSAQTTPKSPVTNPLNDDDFSDVTKKEIIYWSRKLEIAPSQLFLLPKDDLNKRMEDILNRNHESNDEDRQNISERWQYMTQMKEQLIENHANKRLKGGAGRNIYDILAEAANQIEEMYGEASYYDDSQDYDESTMASRTYGTYNASNSCPFREDLTYTLSDEEPTFESTFEDSFQINPNLASTPRCPRQLANNETYSLPARKTANATYQVAPNQTAQYPTNATFTTRQCPMNSTFNARQGPEPNNESFKLPPPAAFNESSRQSSAQQWSPQSMAFMDTSRDKSSSMNANSFATGGVAINSTMNKTSNATGPSIRNFTDYSMTYSPQGTEESANSVSIENYNENSGVIRASSRSYTLPTGSKAGNTTFDMSSAVRGGIGNKTFDISSVLKGGLGNATFNMPSSLVSGPERSAKSPTRCPVAKATAPSPPPPTQCPRNQPTVQPTPARTPINPSTYKPRRLEF